MYNLYLLIICFPYIPSQVFSISIFLSNMFIASPPVIQFLFSFPFFICINDLLYVSLDVSFLDLFKIILIHFFVF